MCVATSSLLSASPSASNLSSSNLCQSHVITVITNITAITTPSNIKHHSARAHEIWSKELHIADWKRKRFFSKCNLRILFIRVVCINKALLPWQILYWSLIRVTGTDSHFYGTNKTKPETGVVDIVLTASKYLRSLHRHWHADTRRQRRHQEAINWAERRRWPGLWWCLWHFIIILAFVLRTKTWDQLWSAERGRPGNDTWWPWLFTKTQTSLGDKMDTFRTHLVFISQFFADPLGHQKLSNICGKIGSDMWVAIKCQKTFTKNKIQLWPQ